MIRYIEQFFYDVYGKTVEQVVQRSSEFPITGSIQCHVKRSFEKTGLVEGVHAYRQGVGMDDL